MQVISHRGFQRGAEVHENTTAAFERALNHGVDGIETDLRLSADSQLVLVHDRVAPDGNPVETLTRRHLEDSLGHEVPTLNDILSRWPDVLWNLEVKCPAAAPPMIELVRRHARPDRILITSFRHDLIVQCARQLNVACGLLMAQHPLDVAPLLQPWQVYPHVRTLVWDYNVVERSLIEQARQFGFQSIVYGAITPREHDLCRTWPVAGIITDYPPRARGQ